LKHEAHALAGQLKHKVQRIELFFSWSDPMSMLVLSTNQLHA
jgi:hypothetical protein